MMNKITQPDISHDKANDAYVVFTGKTEIHWLKFLRKGFRHCFVLLNDGHHWVSVDPLSSYTDILVHHVPADFDFPAWMKKRGYKVIKAQTQKPLKPSPVNFFSCVEAVKRIVGIQNRFVITPWQLYRHLKRVHTPQLSYKGA